MTAPARIAGFAGALLLVGGAAALAGAAADPRGPDPERRPAHERPGEDTAGMTMDRSAPHEGPAAPGLGVAAGGYRLQTLRMRFTAGEDRRLAFRIVGRDGATVRRFDVAHAKRMHLVVVRRDLQSFQHLHPRMDRDGTWSVQADLPAGGVYRMYADFQVGGAKTALGQDVHVAGQYRPRGLAAASRSSRAGGAYDVVLDAGGARSGRTGHLSFTVRRHGRTLTGVQPYLGARGHLVALREGDLAYLHTHPERETRTRGPIGFGVAYPSAGRYRLFLQFRDRGRVRTAAFTQEVAR